MTPSVREGQAWPASSGLPARLRSQIERLITITGRLGDSTRDDLRQRVIFLVDGAIARAADLLGGDDHAA